MTRTLPTLAIIGALAACSYPALPVEPDADVAADAAPDARDAPDATPDAMPAPPDDAPGGITAGMVRVAPGAFGRGCNPDNPNIYPCTSDQARFEVPYRQIALSEFWIDKHEVTQAQWAACVTANGCRVPAPSDRAGYDPATKPDHPVSNVTWADARGFCQWLGKRLPTEAEWEKAARGTDGRLYPWGNAAPTCVLANLGICANGGTSGTHAVGTHPAGDSPYGVSDMAGNVGELTADFWNVGYYAVAPASDPPGPPTGSERVRRGGGFPHSAWDGRAATRTTTLTSGGADYDTGFRCAVNP